MRVSPQCSQCSTWPLSAAVRHASMAAITQRWAFERRSPCSARGRRCPLPRAWRACAPLNRAGFTVSERRSNGLQACRVSGRQRDAVAQSGDCFEESNELFGIENRRQLRGLLAENDPLEGLLLTQGYAVEEA
jgi:hypothetical protein